MCILTVVFSLPSKFPPGVPVQGSVWIGKHREKENLVVETFSGGNT